jgi:crotonobetainyl-CoA:carnitine CoA-transferase CaiB-like acyl-CoA transferase
MAQPMAGVRVLEVASHVFVPAAGAILAEWGADVVKIEHPVTGDPYRGLVTHGLHKTYRGLDVNFQQANRGKQSVGVDLKHPDGRALLDRFAAQSDVFLTSLRPAARQRLRIDVDDLRAVNPALIYVRGSGQGVRGPHADRSGYDSAAYWSRSGISSLLTDADAERPRFPPPAFGDLAGGLALAGAISAALFQRAQTGETSVIDVSLLAMGMWQIQPDIVDGLLREADSGSEEGAPWDQYETWNPLVRHYRTRDGRFIALVVIDAHRHWSELCAVLDAPDLAGDPRFADHTVRSENARSCVERLEAIFAERDYDEWCRILEQFTGAWAPVQAPSEVPSDPQVLANGYVAGADIGDGEALPTVTSPIQFDEQPTTPLRAPEHGEHTEQALLGLGLSWDDIAHLEERGAIP